MRVPRSIGTHASRLSRSAHQSFPQNDIHPFQRCGTHHLQAPLDNRSRPNPSSTSTRSSRTINPSIRPRPGQQPSNTSLVPSKRSTVRSSGTLPSGPSSRLAHIPPTSQRAPVRPRHPSTPPNARAAETLSTLRAAATHRETARLSERQSTYAAFIVFTKARSPPFCNRPADEA